MIIDYSYIAMAVALIPAIFVYIKVNKALNKPVISNVMRGMPVVKADYKARRNENNQAWGKLIGYSVDR